MAPRTKLTEADWTNFLKVRNRKGSKIAGALCKDCRNIIKTVSKNRLEAHRKCCPVKTYANYGNDDMDAEESDPDAAELTNILDQDLAQFFYSASIAFTQVENVHLKRFIHRLQTFNVNYEPPSRISLGGTILDKVHNNILANKKIVLEGTDGVLLVDSWENKSSNRKYLVFSVKNINTPQTFLTFFDTSIERESGENLRDHINAAIEIARDDYDCNIYAIISDNDSKMVSGAKMAKDHGLIRTSCSSHSGNLLIKLLVTKEFLDLIRDILTAFRDPKLESLLLAKGGSKLKNYPDTRFCYLRDTCNSILNNLKYLKELSSVGAVILSDTIKKKLLDDGFKNKLSSIVDNLDPIGTLINKCQDRTSNVADAAQLWLSLQLPTPEYDNHIVERIKKAVHPVGYAANLLHHKYKGQLLDEEQINIASLFLNGYLSDESKFEFDEYSSNDESYGLYAERITNPVAFWLYLKKQNIFPNLAEAALKLMIIPASTAVFEGLFSNWTYVHNSYRNRLGHIKSSKLLDIYYSLKNNLYNKDMINDLMLIEDSEVESLDSVQ